MSLIKLKYLWLKFPYSVIKAKMYLWYYLLEKGNPNPIAQLWYSNEVIMKGNKQYLVFLCIGMPTKCSEKIKV